MFSQRLQIWDKSWLNVIFWIIMSPALGDFSYYQLLSFDSRSILIDLSSGKRKVDHFVWKLRTEIDFLLIWDLKSLNIIREKVLWNNFVRSKIFEKIKKSFNQISSIFVFIHTSVRFARTCQWTKLHGKILIYFR